VLCSASLDGTIGVWDARTGKPLASLHGHGDHVLDIAMDPAGRTLASCGEDGRVLVFGLPQLE